MKFISFSHALVATGLLTLTLALVAALLTLPWFDVLGFVMGMAGRGADRGPVEGPSVVAPTSVLIATIVVGLATLCWGLAQGRGDGRRQELTFSQALVAAGLLGLGITGALAMWPAFFMVAGDWCERVRPVGQYAQTFCGLPDSMRGYRVLHLGLAPPPSYATGMLVMQVVAGALPLAVLGEGLRRLRRDRMAGGLAADGLARSHVVVLLALLSFMAACAAAPPSIESIDFAVGLSQGWRNAPLVVPELVTLGVGCGVPLVILLLAAVRHRWARGNASVWLPVATALLVFALAGTAAADPADTSHGVLGRPGVEHFRLAVVGIVLAGLVWGTFACSTPRGEARGFWSLGEVLGVVAVIGLMLLASATRGAVNQFEFARLGEVTHTWLIATLAAAYAVNLAILAAAVWRLRVEGRREPAPEPGSA
ncbi:MAG: hypothetical protein F4081_00855 [Dehalococcoidia bacterium]|nr:hypothetical protein [Dehalococcoidia bacterium]MYI85353.1 hypothetical protein [Dehalococcoidia bacterium]